MKKKWIALMLVVCIGLSAGVIYIRTQSDHKGPEITCSDKATTEYDPDMNDAQLLRGVKATDEKDGDVSDSLTVESVYEVNDSSVVVTYVAKDSANNITKLKRNMSVSSGKRRKNIIKDAQLSTKSDTGFDSTSSAEDETGNTSKNSMDSVEAQKGGTDVDSAPETTAPEAQASAEQEKQAEAMPAQNPRLYLSEYYMTTSVGSSVDLLSFVKDIQDDKDNISELWRRIQINGQVDTSTAGTYTCTYYVVDSDGNMSNNAELTVVVQ